MTQVDDADDIAEALMEKLGLGGDWLPSNIIGSESNEQQTARRDAILDARKNIGTADGLKGADISKIVASANILSEKKIGACAELACLAYQAFSIHMKKFGRPTIWIIPNKAKDDDYHAYVKLGDDLCIDLWMGKATVGWGYANTPEDHTKIVNEQGSYGPAHPKRIFPPA